MKKSDATRKDPAAFHTLDLMKCDLFERIH